MDNLTKEHILKAGYVIKGLSNSERIKIITLLQAGEMTAATLTFNLKVGKRETLRHLEKLIAIKVVKKERKQAHLRTYQYVLVAKTYERYLLYIKKIHSLQKRTKII